MTKTTNVTRRRWTGEEDNYLQRHYVAKGQDHCARALGRSPLAIRYRAHILGCVGRSGNHPLRRLNDQEVERVCLRTSNLSAAARELGVDRSTLRDYLDRRPELARPGE